MTTFTFTDRASYLAYRAEWKAEYRELSEEIRETRRAIKTSSGDRRSVLQSEKARLRKQANRMMMSLAAAKEEAQRQYLAAKEQEKAA